jgi:hypothetical protein
MIKREEQVPTPAAAGRYQAARDTRTRTSPFFSLRNGRNFLKHLAIVVTNFSGQQPPAFNDLFSI